MEMTQWETHRLAHVAREAKRTNNVRFGGVCWKALTVLWVAAALFGACKSKASGSFEATGGKLGKWTFKPDKCFSGQRQGYFGVLLKRDGDKKHFIKVAKEPATGKTVVTVGIPGTDKGLILKKCKVLKSNVQRTNTTINDIRCLKGSVEIDCPSAHFKGKAKFDNCH
jgi:hypothetical protein